MARIANCSLRETGPHVIEFSTIKSFACLFTRWATSKQAEKAQQAEQGMEPRMHGDVPGTWISPVHMANGVWHTKLGQIHVTQGLWSGCPHGRALMSDPHLHHWPQLLVPSGASSCEQPMHACAFAGDHSAVSVISIDQVH